MMKVKEVIEWCERLAPPQYAEDWDNVGLLLGDREAEVRHIMVALDASDYVVEQAVQQQADLLITHHPMIFHAVKQINTDGMIGRRLWKLAAHRISYYAMHTNFDVMGMAELAAARIGLLETRPLDITAERDGTAEGIGRVGRLAAPVTVRKLAEQVKDSFGLKNVILYGDPGREAQQIAVCPGSGKSEILNALAAGAEILITGDIGHHEGIDAVDMGLTIIDATHYGLEHIFIDAMADYLEGRLPASGAEDGTAPRVTRMDTGSPVQIL